MSYQNRYILTGATDADAVGIAEIFSAQSFDGNLGIQYLRSENPTASFAHEGDDFVCVVVRDTEAHNKIIGIGCCVIRKGYVDGKVCNIGYLTGLKLHAHYQKKFMGIAKAYEWIDEHTKTSVDYLYTTILSDNLYVQKMLEKKRKNMPEYNYLGDYTTLIFKTGGRKKDSNSLQVKHCTAQEAEMFYQTSVKKQQFSICSPTQNHLRNATFFALCKNGRQIALASVCDLREYKQYVVKKYGGAYAFLRHLPTRAFGYPAFPQLDKTVSLSSAAIYFSQEANAQELRYFCSQILANYHETEMLMIGVQENKTLFNAITKLKHISYRSKLYQVSFRKNDLLTAAEFDVDVSFQ